MTSITPFEALHFRLEAMASGQHTEPAATSKEQPDQESKDAREILTDITDASTHTVHDHHGAGEQCQGLQGEWTMYPFEDIREDIGKNGLQALNNVFSMHGSKVHGHRPFYSCAFHGQA
jgi:hypothetical protein